MTINWQQSNLLAMSETDGHGDTCGPIVIADYRHVTQGLQLDVATIDAMRAELIRWQLFDVGMTMTSIATALEQHYGTKVIKLVEWNPSLNFAQFRQDLITAMENHQAVIMETNNAQALPDNQQGIQRHFIIAWGIDSNLGYWCANGDTYTALNHGGTVSPVWYNIGSLNAAQIYAYMILPAWEVEKVSIILEETNGVVTGAHDADDTTKHVGEGYAQKIQAENWLGYEILVGETYTTPNADDSGQYIPGQSPEVSFAVLSNNTSPDAVLTYSAGNGVAAFQSPDLAQVVIDLVNQINRNTAKSDSDTAVVAALTQLQTDLSTLSNAMTTVENDVANLVKTQSVD